MTLQSVRAFDSPDITVRNKNCHGHHLLIEDRCDNAQASEKCLMIFQ